jgi:hypothetical protein
MRSEFRCSDFAKYAGTWAGGFPISSHLTRFKRITNGTAVANFYCP